MYERIASNFHSNYLDTGFWGTVLSILQGYTWPQAHFPCKQQIWEQTKMLDEKGFFLEQWQDCVLEDI